MTDNTQPQTGCPCLYGNPCNPRCTCVLPTSSSGCSRCCRYGSLEQRRAKAVKLIADHAAATKLAELERDDADKFGNYRAQIVALQTSLSNRIEQLADAYAEADALAQVLEDASMGLALALAYYAGSQSPREYADYSQDEAYHAVVSKKRTVDAVLTAHRERVKAREGIIPLDERRHV